MLEKWRKYSYAAQKKQRHRMLKVLIWVFFIFLAYSLVSSCFIKTVELRNDSMDPSFTAGDRLAILTLAWSPIGQLFSRALNPLERGDLILVSMEHESRGLLLKSSNAFVRFFSAQRAGLDTAHSRFTLRRVIGLPGDSVSMDDFTFRVRAKGQEWFLTEHELAAQPYNTRIPPIPRNWSDDFPLSSSMPALTLGENEFFVAADSRSGAGDSRTWGVITSADIDGTVLFRYWPFSRFGRVR